MNKQVDNLDTCNSFSLICGCQLLLFTYSFTFSQLWLFTYFLMLSQLLLLFLNWYLPDLILGAVALLWSCDGPAASPLLGGAGVGAQVAYLRPGVTDPPVMAERAPLVGFRSGAASGGRLGGARVAPRRRPFCRGPHRSSGDGTWCRQ